MIVLQHDGDLDDHWQLVEKSLGISGKGEIENIVPGDKKASIEKFNQLCRESVWKYKEEWEWLTKRMGYWLDLDDPYVTYDSKYIETVWWVISEINRKCLLYKGHKVVPYCPRCGTALSSHEVALGYKNIEEESIYVKFRSMKADLFFLVWTTTPWTLSGNAALAVGPKIKYAIVERENQRYLLAENRVETLLGGEATIIETIDGEEVVERFTSEDLDYEPLYSEGEGYSEAGERAYKLLSADFVSDLDGSGIVHIAPAFGEDDYIFGYQKNNIKVLKTVSEKGESLAGPGKGNFVKDADAEVKLDLEVRGLLFKREKTKHDYPHCWRCDSPLLYFARDSWYIAMSKMRDNLLANNSKINWVPGHLKHGRFGNWLENVNDWAISRDRYWGTPLPIWVCPECKDYKVISSLSEVGNVDPHRPFIDEIELECRCGHKMKRESAVMDVWLDSGAMPYAQWHYPFENEQVFNDQFPAKFIAEAVDQTRGWFYTLLALSTIIKDMTPYENVISLGHLLDEKGKKMSKSKGNIVLPSQVFDKYSADGVRFFFYSVNQPGDAKLYSDKELTAISRNLFITLWNVYSFFMTYASIDKFRPTNQLARKNILDRWILAKLQELVNVVSASLDTYDAYKASNAIIEFVTELSTWYVRRSRRRFWKTENDEDKNNAYETLYYVLSELSKVLAPFTPFFAEALHKGLRQDEDPESVHLMDYPGVAEYDERVLISMNEARRVVETGLALRAEAKVKVRQPLSSITYSGEKLSFEIEDIIAEEVNVKRVDYDEAGEIKIDFAITPELRREGMARELIRNIQALRKKAGFQVENRIVLYLDSSSTILSDTIAEHGANIACEVLAESTEKGRAETEASEEFDIEGEKIWVGISRV